MSNRSMTKKQMQASNFLIAQPAESLRKQLALPKPDLTESGFLETFKNGYIKGFGDAISGRPSIYSRESQDV